MNAVVFCGPTVGGAEVQAKLPGADCRPPAAQGDVFAASRTKPDLLVIIDGVFLDVPSVWHREILAALEEGIAVVGAASMGALRAVECEAFGMTGCGKIFEAYRAGRYAPFEEPFEDDDEVAVVHGPAELGSPSLSDAMVDLRETLARAEAAGAIDRRTRDRLAARMKATYFADRSFERMVAPATEEMSAEAGSALASALARHRCSQKREDALALLTRLAETLPEAPEVTWRYERTGDWERYAETAGQAPLGARERRALEALADDPARERRIVRRAVARVSALESAGDGGDARAALNDFRLDRGLVSRADLDGWAGSNALPPERLARLMRDEAALEALARRHGRERLAAAMLDELRLEDRFASLAGNAGESEA